MITLITGAPGAGKSAALVRLLSELSKGRAIFVDGIPELKVPHVPLTMPHNWMDEVPDGAAVVIDEVQRIWRPAGAGSRIPPDIAALETHRHRGLDFYIVTQHPKLVHANVRALVGRHVHLRDIGVLGRWWYEWPEAVDPATWRSAPVKKKYRLSKSHFALYKSASEHIKPIRSIPPVVLLLVAAVVGVAVLGWMVWGSIKSRISPAPAPGVVAKAAPLGSPSGASIPSGGKAVANVSALTIIQGFTPRLAHMPETAPAYDHLRVVVAMPRIVGGFCRDDVCYCYTQQGTNPGVGNEACRAWLKAPPFDPYRAPALAAPLPAPAPAPQASGHGADLGNPPS